MADRETAQQRRRRLRLLAMGTVLSQRQALSGSNPAQGELLAWTLVEARALFQMRAGVVSGKLGGPDDAPKRRLWQINGCLASS